MISPFIGTGREDMKKIQTHKMSYKLRWFFAAYILRAGINLLFGWGELERYLTKKTNTMIFKYTINFHEK